MVDFDDLKKVKVSDVRNIAVYCCLFIFSIFVIVLISISFTITEIDEISLAHNWVSNSIYYHEEWSGPGRHFTGPFISFRKFRRTRILIDFSEDVERGDAGGARMACWSKEGTNVYLDISFYFRFKPSQMESFYKEFGPEYMDFIVRSSYVAIKETTIQYSTVDFFTKRNEIQDAIAATIQQRFKDHFFEAA